ncbi:MAG: alkanesulfonate monooxygenase SsuD [Gammaproteobacteria bacterium]|jgi:alkanesulfonate monooxygenase SsuD/methylene tetrahydromethanopterin reductase-like flavin-dependent oxidoreductase (luciferase family)
MDFGVFNLLQHRHRSKSSHEIIQEAMEHTVLAEQLGFGRAWFAEHHFSNYSLCPSPLILCTHAAAITERIRIGTSVLILPLHTPARLISEVALVDALSKGRFDLGVGSGYQNYEFERLGADLSKNKLVFKEMLDMLELGLSQPTFSYDGEYYKQKQTGINVKPVQRPCPPVWIAGADPESHRRCARDGYIPFVSGGIESAGRIRLLRDQIERIFVEEGRDADSVPLGVLRFVFVSDDQAQVANYVESARYQKRIAMALRTRQEVMVEDYMVDEVPISGETDLDEIKRNLIVGDVEAVAEQLCAEIELYRPAHMSIYFAVGDVPNQAVTRSMELFATKVIPLLEKHFGRPLAEIGEVAPKGN